MWMLFPKEEEYIEWFERAGFKDVKLKRTGPKWYRGVRRHGLIIGCAVTGVKPAIGNSPLQDLINGLLNQFLSSKEEESMEQHVVKRARNVRAEEVEEDNSRVGDAPEKELTMACLKDRESDSEQAEYSGEEN
ncbi:hypothetical protein Scep_030116 [Stephania cephalantha]|uniref:MPBQ/MBSQ family SAM-binding methyltransferase profile domain-containing protein n=1 Tax=Stephania cephalantha TaxID=152367 RepID=A0AAP0E1V3_9MAGN